jgi:hypothetical protein
MSYADFDDYDSGIEAEDANSQEARIDASSEEGRYRMSISPQSKIYLF